jgi:hypothetical protein
MDSSDRKAFASLQIGGTHPQTLKICDMTAKPMFPPIWNWESLNFPFGKGKSRGNRVVDY